MEILYFLLLVTSVIFLIYKTIKNRVITRKLPPGPPSLPIIGHFHLWKRPIPLNLYNFSKKYGPIFFLRLGSRPVLVVSSPAAVEECFTKNDITFANRPLFPSREVAEYGFSTLAVCPYGPHWKNLRRLTATELFSSARLQGSSTLRAEEVRFLVKQLFQSSSREVEIESFFFILTFNIMMKLVSGNRYLDGDFRFENTGSRLDELREMFSPTISLLLSDHFPILKWLTFRRGERNILKMHKKKDDFLQALVDVRRSASSSSSITDGEKRQLLIDVMLSLQKSEPDSYSDEIIKGMIMVIFASGTLTSASTMESAVSHLISQPEILRKSREEIDENIGQNQLLHDSALSKLPYLHCIINETLRFGSTAPLLPPHESKKECTVGGYTIPKGTMLLVHAQTLYNDPKLWEDPDVFKPERFQGSRLNGEKGAYKFFPFGLGRRQCPGEGLAMRLIALTLGTLIQCFEWKKAIEDLQADGVATNLQKEKDGTLKVIFQPRETLGPNIISQF